MISKIIDARKQLKLYRELKERKKALEKKLKGFSKYYQPSEYPTNTLRHGARAANPHRDKPLEGRLGIWEQEMMPLKEALASVKAELAAMDDVLEHIRTSYSDGKRMHTVLKLRYIVNKPMEMKTIARRLDPQNPYLSERQAYRIEDKALLIFERCYPWPT